MESFGLHHQAPTLLLRKSEINRNKDYYIYLMDIVFESNITDFDSHNNMEKMLLTFLSLNLKTVINYKTDKNNTLTLYFKDDWIRFLSGGITYEFL